VVGTGGKRVQAGLDRGALLAEATCFARDLVNEPGGALTPRALAQVAVEVAEREGLRVSVLDQVDIEAAGLGGLLGVNRGSSEPPRFIELAYEPERPRGHLALVGKGITFDSGGLSLKTAEGMMGMKGDMGGAAAVLAAMSAVRGVAPRMRVSAYLPATDNMPGGDATRPGDVLRIRNGKTVEVLNTDAEGRLILADGLSLASEAQPDAIIDLATLTGACVVALGDRIAGLMGNHDGLLDQVRRAAERAGEPVWPLPLPVSYRDSLLSSVADLRNISMGKYGGALTAGLFLQQFVAEGIPWAHLDIAGPAYFSEDDAYQVKGGTGFGVRTLLELLASFRKPAAP
jgi:leucyl aminopeptidase